MHLAGGGGGDSTRTRANDRPGEYSHYIRTVYATEVRMRISGYLYDVTTNDQTSRFIVSVRIGHWRYLTTDYIVHVHVAYTDVGRSLVKSLQLNFSTPLFLCVVAEGTAHCGSEKVRAHRYLKSLQAVLILPTPYIREPRHCLNKRGREFFRFRSELSLQFKFIYACVKGPGTYSTIDQPGGNK